MNKKKISLVQFEPEWENVSLNIEKVKSIDFNETDLIVFPEMTLTGFSMNPSKLAEDLKGTSFSFFASIADKYKTFIAAGIIEKFEDKYFNTLLFINENGELVSSYRKIHPFSFSNEDKFYSGGDQTVTANWNGLNVGFSICYDLRFPELFRYYGKDRCDLILNIANWPITRINHFTHLLKARAIENQCFVIGVNRIGNDPNAIYNGNSSVFSPLGKEILCMKENEKIGKIEIDFSEVTDVRKKFPFLNDIKLI